MQRSDGPPPPATASSPERDYVLGTHDEEIRRLEFQHGVWKQEVHRAWADAGIRAGMRVGDFGAGPGFATTDLAAVVGPHGRVVAVERSARFLEVLRARAAALGATNIAPLEADLMDEHLPVADLDAIWCRWVACFVPDVGRLVDHFHRSLARGGTLITHEYVEYSSFQTVPPRAPLQDFVAAVFESWRAQGGEPDIARVLTRLLCDRGFSIRSARPIAFAAKPSEVVWNWPAGFVRTNVPRLVDLGVRDSAWAESVLQALSEAEQDPASIFVTPTVLEIVAVKE